MRKSKSSPKLSAAVLCATIVASLVVGLSGASASVASKKAQVTISLEFVNSFQSAWTVLIANFERVYPNITIQPVYLTGAQETTTLPAEIAAGDAPDIIYAQPGAGTAFSLWPLAQAGDLAPLTGSPWIKRVPASALPGVTVGGKIYGFPLAFGPNGLLYNVDLFKQLGLSVPQTFPDLLAMCKKISAAGKIPIALGLNASSTIGINIMMLQLMDQFVYSKDPAWDVQRFANKVDFATSPLWNTLFNQISNMYKAGCFESNPAAVSYPTGTANLLASGQAVMEFLTGGTLSTVTSIDPNFNYAMFEVPPTKSTGNTVMSVSEGLSISISSKTAHMAEAQEFVNFIGRSEQDSLWASLAHSIAPFDAKSGVLPSYLSSADPLAKAGKVLINPYYDWPSAAFTNEVYADVTGLMTGQQTVHGALTDLDNYWSSFPASSNK